MKTVFDTSDANMKIEDVNLNKYNGKISPKFILL
jgi:hypothetical protein